MSRFNFFFKNLLVTSWIYKKLNKISIGLLFPKIRILQRLTKKIRTFSRTCCGYVTTTPVCCGYVTTTPMEYRRLSAQRDIFSVNDFIVLNIVVVCLNYNIYYLFRLWDYILLKNNVCQQTIDYYISAAKAHLLHRMSRGDLGRSIRGFQKIMIRRPNHANFSQVRFETKDWW
jgi:hypothetical protein